MWNPGEWQSPQRQIPQVLFPWSVVFICSDTIKRLHHTCSPVFSEVDIPVNGRNAQENAPRKAATTTTWITGGWKRGVIKSKKVGNECKLLPGKDFYKGFLYQSWLPALKKASGCLFLFERVRQRDKQRQPNRQVFGLPWNFYRYDCGSLCHFR